MRTIENIQTHKLGYEAKKKKKTKVSVAWKNLFDFLLIT